jgi:hypothetical protein
VALEYQHLARERMRGTGARPEGGLESSFFMNTRQNGKQNLGC